MVNGIAPGDAPLAGRPLRLRNSWSLVFRGFRERHVFARLARDGAHFSLTGDIWGQMEIPVDTITRIRAGGRPGIKKFHRCLIWREGAWPIAVYGTQPWDDYAAFVRWLGRQLERRGRLDRVQRGLPVWHAVLLLLICGVALPPLAFHAWLWLTWGHRATKAQGWYLIGLSSFWVALFLWGLVIWWRRYRPRRVRDLADLEAALPNW